MQQYKRLGKKYTASKSEVLRGSMSLPSYKSDQPILINKTCVHLFHNEQCAGVELSLFSRSYKKEKQLKENLVFSIQLHDGTQRSIFQNLLSDVYKLGECQLVYKKKKWFLFITYLFKPQEHQLDPEKILGIDLGEHYAVYASSVHDAGQLIIDGGRVTKYADVLEKQRQFQQHQARYCSDGRVGHGTKTRVAPAYQAGNRLAHFRDTINHQYSHEIIDYAVKHGYGTIQMENLQSIKASTGFPKRLQHWTYYDLQQKIEAKAKENGITVTKINPRYTSQRCSQCGHIDALNRPSQAEFHCTMCGYKANADHNASQNISIKDIERIIEEALRANQQ